MMSEEEYIDSRLNDQIKWYSQKSAINQKYYKRLKLMEITAATLIPFLSGFSTQIPYVQWVIALLGVIIAIAAGVESLYKFQENWITYRATAESLKHEKFLYLTNSEPYDAQNRFATLVSRVEHIIDKENKNWSIYTQKDSATSAH
ncbi:MAG TPA: DUF4231 domain-containing protein [Nitratifractor sp.]|nr:DUF4231 domain-containing protein [Nitratifractor sp.]